jgi:hypothetical protein
MEFSRKALIDDRSFPWYDLTSTAGREVDPLYAGVLGDDVVLRRTIAPPNRMMRPNTMTTTNFEFIINELIAGSY